MPDLPTPTIDTLSDHEGQTVTLRGWLYNKRTSKGLAFLVMRDGTGLCQCVANQDAVDPDSWEAAQAMGQESSLAVTGTVVKDPRQVGGFEVQATRVELIGASEDYPISPKEHGVEFLMNNRHLWLRSRKQWAIMRVRNRVIQSIHAFFQERGFLQMDAPILTGNAVEGTTTLFELDYFDEPAYLTQSGQLYGEALAMAFGKIYTFGPTFRAEKSKTRRHLTEFWMIEPEMAFCDLEGDMELAEAFLQRIATDVLATCGEELDVLERPREPLEQTASGSFPRLSYTDAVELLTSPKTLDLIDAKITALHEEQSALERRAGRRSGALPKRQKRREAPHRRASHRDCWSAERGRRRTA